MGYFIFDSWPSYHKYGAPPVGSYDDLNHSIILLVNMQIILAIVVLPAIYYNLLLVKKNLQIIKSLDDEGLKNLLNYRNLNFIFSYRLPLFYLTKNQIYISRFWMLYKINYTDILSLKTNRYVTRRVSYQLIIKTDFKNYSFISSNRRIIEFAVENMIQKNRKIKEE